MKAIILAGEQGRALHPLTEEMPLAMIPICGVPLLEHLLQSLLEQGVREALVVTGYLPHGIAALCRCIGERCRELSLTLVQGEEEPGAFVADWLGEDPSPVLVVAADRTALPGLRDGLDAHHRQDARLTVLTDRTGSSPGQDGQTPPELAACCLADPRLFQNFPDGSLLHPEVLPRWLAHEAGAVHFHRLSGSVRRMDGVGAYLDAHTDLLNRYPHNRFADGHPPDNLTIAGGPVWIGRHVRAAPGSVVEGPCWIGDGCYIGRNARIIRSVLLDRVQVGNRVRADGALLCSDSTVKQGGMVGSGGCVGPRAVVGEHAVIRSGIRLGCGRYAAPHRIVGVDGSGEVPGASRSEPDQIRGTVGVEITPELATRIGSAVGTLLGEGRIAVGSDGDACSSALKQAVVAGIRSTGCDAMDFGENFLAQFRFSMTFCSLSYGVYLRGGNRGAVYLLGEGGLPLPHREAAMLDGLLGSGDVLRRPHAGFGDCVPMTGMDSVYRSHILRYAPEGLDGVAAQVTSRNFAAGSALRQTLQRLGCDTERGLRIELSAKGDRLRVLEEDIGFLSAQRVFCWCAVSRMREGGELALPWNAPHILDSFARDAGCAIRRYGGGEDACDDARALAALQGWTQDGLIQAVMLLDLLRRFGGLTPALEAMPEIDTSHRYLDTAATADKLLQTLGGSRRSNGDILLREDRGIVLLRPQQAGLHILAEAANAEIADELCADIHEKINRLSRR